MMPRWWYLLIACAGGGALGSLLAWHQLHDPGGAAVARPLAASAVVAAGASSALPASPVRDITSLDELSRLAQEHPQGVLLDFHAPWCVPCQELAPRLVRLAQLHPLLVVAAIDAATYPKIADAYNVDVLPALVHLVNGHEVARKVGAPSEAELTAWLGLPPPAATTVVSPSPSSNGR